MTDFRNDIHAKLHSRFGVSAIYYPVTGPSKTVTVKLRLGVDVYGEEFEIVGTENHLTFLSMDIDDAKNKATFIVDNIEYQLLSKVKDDGVRQIWQVKRAS